MSIVIESPQCFVERPPPRHGTHALLWAVFIDGIQTYCRAIANGATNGLEYREAERWIFSPYLEGGVTGFSHLCELFEVDPRRLRRKLLHFREDPRTDVVEMLLRNAA